MSVEMNQPDPQKSVANVDSDDLATNENRVIPWGWGTVVAPLLWMGQTFDQVTVDAPVERPSKK